MIVSRYAGDDPIETYLDELLAGLRGTARDVRHTVAECETHLRERAEALEASGVSPREAASQAVTDFGDVATITADFNRAHRRGAARALLPAAAFQTARLGAAGLIAIGISGMIAWVWTFVAGTSAVFADTPGTHYDPASCAHYLAVQTSARTCAAAALLEGRDDALTQRWAAGVLGVLLLLVTLWWRRRSAAAPADLRAPAALVGVVVFAAAGVGLTGYGIDRAVINTGSGQWISAGAVALAFAAAYLIVLWRRATAVPL
jgi:hypothetical protein